jgi:hypothetical protein
MNRDISFEQMCKPCKVWEEAEVPYRDPPMQNAYEMAKPESKGYDQSGMR